MVISCNVPSFNNLTPDQKIKKIEKYLNELNDQLHIVLNNLELDNFTLQTQNAINISEETKNLIENDLEASIEAIKNRIIKTADEINSTIQSEISVMSGQVEYISGQFGTFTEDYFKESVENALNKTDTYTTIKNLNGYITTSQSYIKTGNISADIGSAEDKIGIVIGDAITGDNQSSNMKVVIVGDRMSFYEGTNEVAYISGKELVINKVKINEYIYFGSYKIDVINGIAFRWEVQDG